MRLTISSKLFLGFLCVIFLNAIFVILINKLSDLNSLADILKRQDHVKNELLNVASLQSDKRRSRTSFEAIGRSESVENFKQTGKTMLQGLDSVNLELSAISRLDSSVFRKSVATNDHYESHLKLLSLVNAVEQYTALYDKSFATLAFSGKRPDSLKYVAGDKGLPLIRVLDSADMRLTKSLKSADFLIDEQTKSAIKATEGRISDIKQMTIIILGIVVLVALGFALFFSLVITNSLRRLKESASLIGKGDFSFDKSGYPTDEIGDLAAAFYDMAADLKKTQEELVKSKRLAAIGEVVASVNHEINNPLMIISGNAQFLQMSMKDYPEEMKERVKVILEETDRISAVTRKMREIKNPIVEEYTSSGEQMINLDKSSTE
ncbi:MAG TPA: histidine kinase dimerization/phospho-acceptor domain-containing protein [Chitinivibrionales bacterium]|nr:histidine kinase dimerization/phospho-acceptor domain-containing protein [Chitinivibrionales bacterium]